MTTTKATAISFTYAGIQIEGLLLPDGEYRITLAEGIECIQQLKLGVSDYSSLLWIVDTSGRTTLLDLDTEDFNDDCPLLYSIGGCIFIERDDEILDLGSLILPEPSPLSFEKVLTYIIAKYKRSQALFFSNHFTKYTNPSNPLDKAFSKSLLFNEVFTRKEDTKSVPMCETAKTKKIPKGYIYVVELDGCLKIGFSTQLTQRLASYKTSSVIVKLIHKETSTLEKEKRFHKKFGSNSEKYAKDFDWRSALKQMAVEEAISKL